MARWVKQIVDGQLHRLEKRLADAGRTEAFDLEAWIASHPAIIEQDLLIIGRQVQTKFGPLDLARLIAGEAW